MTRYNYLERRGKSGTYYARIDIPTDLVSHLGCEVRKKSLRTKDENEARTRLWPIIEAWRAEFADIKSRREITADDKAEAVWQHYEATLQHDDQKRRAMPTPSDMDAEEQRLLRRIEKGEINSDSFAGMINAHTELELMLRARTDDANLRARRLTALKAALISGDIRTIEPAVKDFITRHRLLVEIGSDEYRELCDLMTRAEVEGLQRTLERDGGDFTGTPRDPIVKPGTGTAREAAAPGESIMDLFDTYARENPNQIKPDTLAQARRDVGLFVEHVGSTFPVHRIDKKAVREWKALLLQYPVKATETKAFEGMKLAQIVKHNATVKKPTISTTTVNRYLSGFSAFCTWLTNHGYLQQNPAADMFLKKSKEKTTKPFTVDQMNALFKSPFFTGCQSDEAPRFWSKRGNVTIRDHRFWVPLVMLYSGARPAEIAQLGIEDVRQEHGHWIMHITTEGDGDKSVKTNGSMRVVPVHKELVRLGFLKYHADMRKAGNTRLFPLAERNERGQMIADFSRDFPRYLIKIGLKNGRGLSLYSFRHGVADALRRAGYLDEQFGFILGHVAGTMTQRYGTLPQGMIEQRAELINAIAYPDLKLDHLRENHESAEAQVATG
ncbi:site-specific integrase [Sinorhizobium meliloti]|uniref:site-specific integrase n=1 Tax=Rhizobium meliloti TaxID=382 RepID=UPI000FD8EFD5|nr:site-specific integrase [Sinorhizobium meliloti]RVE93513.1 site-specific integrase [Sinorhizobium meliloti]RVH34350.1 site-specific integrase [Sinorhizobium meliloti]